MSPNGDQDRWFDPRGEADFDSDIEMKAASVLLTDGKRIEFHRFGSLPGPDAAESQLDARPFFDVSIDGVRFNTGWHTTRK